MKPSRKFIHGVLATLILIGAAAQFSAIQPALADESFPPLTPEKNHKVDYTEGKLGISAAETATSDNFGYSLDASGTSSWKNLVSGGTAVDTFS